MVITLADGLAPVARLASVLVVTAVALGACGGSLAVPMQAPEEAPRQPAAVASDLLASGQAWLQDARESADPASLARAEEAYRRLLDIEPDSAEAVLGLGVVALARHDFALGLELGQQAARLAPGSARPLGVIVDALIELGRYDEAGDAIEQMLRARPDLASYTRLSYYHELHGRQEQAIEAMERAVIAGGPTAENTEFARVLLGDLWRRNGDIGRAEGLYRTALENLPGYVPALRGLARVAEAQGDLEHAITLYEQAVEQVPLLDLLISLGEAQLAAGRADDAGASFALVRDIGGYLRANGVATDLDLARFEADHGDPTLAAEMARAAYEAAPSIRSADALAWALYRAGRFAEARTYAAEALRTGSLEPAFRYHAGLIALALEDRSSAALLEASASR